MKERVGKKSEKETEKAGKREREEGLGTGREGEMIQRIKEL